MVYITSKCATSILDRLKAILPHTDGAQFILRVNTIKKVNKSSF